MPETMRIDAIRIGERARKDMGDIDGLARSIAEVGLLHPVVVRPDGLLIAGVRRLEACKHLGLVDVAVTVVDLDNPRAGERAENVERKDFIPSEAVAIWEATEGQSGYRTDLRANGAEVAVSPRRQTAQFTGVGERTLTRARAVVESGDTELIAQMDETGNVDHAWRELQQANILPPPPIPQGKYRVIYADPPWQFDNSGFAQSAASIYPTMPTDAICALPIQDLGAPDGTVLFLWATNAMLLDALRVMAAWGYKYKTNFAWCKDRAPGMGWYTNSKHELLLLGTCNATMHPKEKLDSWQQYATGGHSEKPPEWRILIERMYDGPYIELFGRRQKAAGWQVWGNELTE